MIAPPLSTLPGALTAAGVKEADALVLASAFPSDADAFVAGLRAAVACVEEGAYPAGVGLCEPWAAIVARLTDEGQGVTGTEILDEVGIYPPPVPGAILGALASAADAIYRPAPPTPAKVRTKRAPRPEHVPQSYLGLIDADCYRVVQALLASGGNVGRARKDAGNQLIQWLANHGKFVKTPQGARYYLYNDGAKLYPLGGSEWEAFLYRLTGCNPKSVEHAYLHADCMSAALEGASIPVVRLAHWDDAARELRVSRFDGTVYCLDGDAITEERNGAGPALFEDDPRWLPYEPDYASAPGSLDWSTVAAPNWSDDRDIQGMVLRTWWLSTFFTELCPTRPLLILRGEKGSGKTSAIRSLLQLTYGPAVDVLGAPDKPDALAAMAAANHVLALDNFDDAAPWMRDKLAGLSTGKADQVRELYTTNDTRTIEYRCWIAVTSRTPDTFQRDDIADRVVILPLERMDSAERQSESSLRRVGAERRAAWWGDVLVSLNAIVAEIRDRGIPIRGGLRLEDWAALGSAIARVTHQSAEWARAVAWVQQSQAALMLDQDIVMEAVEQWTADVAWAPTGWISTRTLYALCQSALFPGARPEQSWPRSAKGFGRRLHGIRRELAARLREQGIALEDRVSRGVVEWRLTK